MGDGGLVVIAIRYPLFALAGLEVGPELAEFRILVLRDEKPVHPGYPESSSKSWYANTR
jgi:hypothetical protein